MTDALVVGSGPNGLSAALTLARAGLEVSVVEGAEEPGGGCRSAELTEPGYLHDVCSTIQSLLGLSPFFSSVDLAARGVTLARTPVALAHPLEGGRCALLYPSLSDTAAGLGADGRAWRSVVKPLLDHAPAVAASLLAPIRTPPRAPLAMAHFLRVGLASATRLSRRFGTTEARALVGGLAAHAMLPLSAPLTAGYGIFLAVSAHHDGWPVVTGGSGRLVEALLAELADAGVTVESGRWVRAPGDLGDARVVMLDTSVGTLLDAGGDRLSPAYRRAAARYRYGPGVCKVDWALSGPVPWAAEGARRATTVHVGGTFEEVAAAEAQVAAGRHPDRPFVIAVQAASADPSRAPAGAATLWAYSHVPSGSDRDVTDAIESQIERFAPGFRDTIVARRTTTAAQYPAYNPNYVGGDINGGAGDLRQLLFRPVARWNPYRAAKGLYLCSSATPPGGGVHGMSGVHAAKSALRDLALRRGQ